MGTSRLAWVAWVAAAMVMVGAGVAIVAGPAVAAGATFTVNNTSTGGGGSLNKAITDAAAHAGADTIVFAANTNGHVLPAPTTISSDVTIKGNGRGVTIVNGTFDVNTDGATSATTAFSNLSVGAFDFNSDNRSSTIATVTNVAVTKSGVDINSDFGSNSRATFAGSPVAGGVDVNSDNLSNSSGSFTGGSIAGGLDVNSDNKSNSSGSFTGLNISGGIDVNSDIGSNTTATFTNVRVTGGGMDTNSDGSSTNVTITNSTISGASAEPLSANTSGTTVTIVGSTFSNSADSIDAVSGARISMTNSTLTGLGEGGVRSTGSVTLQNVTITKNKGPAVAAISGSMSIGNSILGPNTLGGENGSHECQISDASFTSHGGNVSDDASCHPIAGDHANTQSKLGAFGANGGATSTFVPLAGSAAIDGGVAAGCPGSDQRGVRRPQDGDRNGSVVCDSGAVEVAGASPTVTTVAPTTVASTPVTQGATPTTVAAAAELPRTGSSSGPLAALGLVLLLAGAAVLYGPRMRRAPTRP